jgi:isoquinoline 1-oxidoreductase
MMAGFDKGGYISCCAEVTVADNKITVDRVVQSFECGAIVNPEQLRNLLTGSIIQGLGGALTEAIEFENGRILNPHLARYRVPRFGDVPQIEVVMLDRRDLPSAGAGETPIVGVAPAIANAVFDATGKRIRSMPLKLS